MSEKSNTSVELQFENVCHGFRSGDRVISVLKGIDLRIHRGEVLALAAPSGSGKTTLLHIAALLEKPQQGQVFLCGQPVHNASDRTSTKLRRDHLGFIFQQHRLLDELTALENAAMPLLVQGMERKKALRITLELLEEVGMLDRIDHRPAALSGGEKQRVAVVRGVVHRPRLILADEPTGALDRKNALGVFDMLLRLRKKFESSLMVVSHDLEIVRRADQIRTIEDGKIKPLVLPK